MPGWPPRPTGREVAALRTRVFVEEQGVPPEMERDAADATAVHVLSRGTAGELAGRVVATGRLVVRDGRAVIGRMAAHPLVRGRGHGAAVLAELHRQAGAARAGRDRAARPGRRPRLLRAGRIRARSGEEYEEAGIRHVTMRRAL